jgi:NAD(P)H dehydrogenase (quinone)
MTSKLVLVTGATGDTGGYAVPALAKLGVSIRALVRKNDERAARPRASGIEVILGDLLDLDSVRSAMEGVSTAYFVYPLLPGLIDATAYFAQAAREAGLNGVVNMSQISARRGSKSHQARDHWISERVFDWSGLSVTHLRPTFFAQWLTYTYMWARQEIAQKGVIRLRNFRAAQPLRHHTKRMRIEGSPNVPRLLLGGAFTISMRGGFASSSSFNTCRL